MYFLNWCLCFSVEVRFFEVCVGFGMVIVGI